MTRQISESSAVARLATDVFAPAAFEYLFWRPRHLVDEPAVAHLPLLFWICAALGPKEVAVVGAGDGVVHFALCQAMDRMVGQGRCSGYGFWKDTASGGFASTVPQKLASHQEMLYEDISRLVPSQDPDIVVDCLGPAALDLLWLDITAAPAGLIQRAELFSRSLKQSGVMFVHGVATLPHDGADAAALKRLLNSQRCVRFDDEKGLLLVVLDGNVPTRIEALEAAAERGVLASEVERIFRRIGQGLLSSIRATNALAARKNAEKRTAEATQAREIAENSLKELNSAYDLRNRKVAELQSDLFDTQILLADLKAQVAANDAERVAERLGHEVVLAELERQRAAFAQAEEAFRHRLANLEDARSAREAADQAALAEVSRQRDVLLEETAQLGAELQAAEEARFALEASHEKSLTNFEEQLDTFSEEAVGLRAQLVAADEVRLALEAMHQQALEKSERQRDALSAEADGLRDRLKTMESHHAFVETKHRTDLAEAEKEKQSLSEALQSERSARFAETAALTRIAEDLSSEVTELTSRNEEIAKTAEAVHVKTLADAEQERETLRLDVDGLRHRLSAIENDRAALEAAHTIAVDDADRAGRAHAEALQSERSARFAETAALTRIAEDLRKEVEALTACNSDLTTNLATTRNLAKQTDENLKAEIANERRVRFRESALTRMFEDLKAENATKKRRLEAWLVEKLVRSERKLKKYRRDRKAFFSDSRSGLARAYFRLRAGA